METLTCMKTHRDGAHCGLTDWYSEIEAGIVEALARGPDHEWTTDWYSSKKEIATARITCSGGRIRCEVSVSDDFDTNGNGSDEIEHTCDLEAIHASVYRAWELAEQDQRENRCYCGYKILCNGKWVETYIQPAGDGCMMDNPPGDNYHQWGFQGDCELRDSTKRSIASRIQSNTFDGCRIDGYTVEEWED